MWFVGIVDEDILFEVFCLLVDGWVSELLFEVVDDMCYDEVDLYFD